MAAFEREMSESSERLEAGENMDDLPRVTNNSVKPAGPSTLALIASGAAVFTMHGKPLFGRPALE